MKTILDELIEYCKKDGRICPMPIYWNELWNKLKDKQRVGHSWEPPPPLILAAWGEPALLKQLRLEEHLKWAEKKGQLKEIAEYLRSLNEDQWFHLGD